MNAWKKLASALTVFALLLAVSLAISPLMGGCHDDEEQAAAAPATPASVDTWAEDDDLPGVVLAIAELQDGSGTATGTATAPVTSGTTLKVKFSVKYTNGSNLPLSLLDGTEIMVSGPVTSYQRVINKITDWHKNSTDIGGGFYTYTITTSYPSTYGAPYNDTTTFTDGEKTGQTLDNGTYTVGMTAYKNYIVNGDTYPDAGSVTKDFRYGTPAALDAAREVVKIDNCNQCHVKLQMHSGRRRGSPTLCLLCHTAGAEDGNNPAVESGTPNVTVEFKVMIHKIHNGLHLPSVLGVSTKDDGTRNYAATATPYKVVGDNDVVKDFSKVAYPVWPSLSYGMPRDTGYYTDTGASSTTRSLEDNILKGVVACDKCHGAGTGFSAPSQGANYYSEPSRRACGSCHDDVRWDKPYISNGLTMAANQTDTPSNCNTNCHSGTTIPTVDTAQAHKHPLFRTAAFGTMTFVNPGFNLTLTTVAEPSGDGNGNDNGIVEAGEKIAITFTAKNDATTDITFASESTTNGYSQSLFALVNGPTKNTNLLLYTAFPKKIINGSPTYTSNLPAPQFLEYVGKGTSSATDPFTVAYGPIWATADFISTHPYYVHTVSAPGAGATLAAANSVYQTYLDVADGAGSVFARGDYVVVDNDVSGKEEYLCVQRVQADYSGTTDRLWFASPYQLSSVGTSAFSSTLNSKTFGPWLRVAHGVGASINKVTLTLLTVTTQYTVSGSTITEVGSSIGTDVKVLASYTGDYKVPSVYPTTFNSSPDLDETWGKWEGKPLVDGTYTVTIWGSRSYYTTPVGVLTSTAPSTSNDNTSHPCPAKSVAKDFLLGTTETVVEPYALISSSANCEQCHTELMFHGGSRRGFNSCISCKAPAGTEDWPWYRASSSGVFPAIQTVGLTINFRTMLHKIHMGSGLANASTYKILGNSASENSYEEVVFPPMPMEIGIGGVKYCVKCHGSQNTAWQEPKDRSHPTSQSKPLKRWSVVCNSCHDGTEPTEHIALMTSASGYEWCGMCHDPGGIKNIKRVHKVR